jgi:hypothetical protein
MIMNTDSIITKQSTPQAVVMLVPTGVGACIGGYAGDATHALHTVAAASPVCITHPNVLNAAMFFNKPANTLYVEGAGLDKFLAGHWALRPVQQQCVGIIWDAGIDARMRILHDNTCRAVQTIYGVTIGPGITTTAPLSLWCDVLPSGSSHGGLRNPDVLLAAAKQAVAAGATALAICAAFPDSLTGETDYLQGQGPDPVGGLEAILSHWLVQQLGIPCAHAPVFSVEASQPEMAHVVDPRVAAEVITPTFLPCILQGLAQAPDFIPVEHANVNTDFTWRDVAAVVVPQHTLGGGGTIAALHQHIPVIAVAENTTVCHTPAIQPTWTLPTYSAVATWLAAHVG